MTPEITVWRSEALEKAAFFQCISAIPGDSTVFSRYSSTSLDSCPTGFRSRAKYKKAGPGNGDHRAPRENAIAIRFALRARGRFQIMPARSISTASLTFGLVSIPVRLFPATSSKSVSLPSAAREGHEPHPAEDLLPQGRQDRRSQRAGARLRSREGSLRHLHRRGTEEARGAGRSRRRNNRVHSRVGSRSRLLREFLSARMRADVRQGVSPAAGSDDQGREGRRREIHDARKGTGRPHSSRTTAA